MQHDWCFVGFLVHLDRADRRCTPLCLHLGVCSFYRHWYWRRALNGATYSMFLFFPLSKPYLKLADLRYALWSTNTSSMYLALTSFITLVLPLLPSRVETYSSPGRARGFFVPLLVMIHSCSSSSGVNYLALANLAVNILVVIQTHFVCSISQAYLLALSQGLTVLSTHVTVKLARLG